MEKLSRKEKLIN
jgi:hypothetical protein